MSFQQTFAFADPAESFAAPTKPAECHSPVSRKSCPSKSTAPKPATPPESLDSPDSPAVLPTRDQILRDLRARTGCIPIVEDQPGQDVGRAILAGPRIETFSTGSPDIDGLLPRGGLKVNSITEWVGGNHSNATCALSLVTAAGWLTRHAGPLVVVARPADFYPPAAVALGIPADRMIWVRPNRHADAVWSIDQSLRCESVAAVWSLVGAELDDRDARRFQLASEAGRTPGLMVRPIATRGKPTFAETRFHVAMDRNVRFETRHQTSFPTLRVTLDRCRGSVGGKEATVMIDDRGRLISLAAKSAPAFQPHPLQPDRHHETAAMRLASELAHPKTPTGRPSSHRADPSQGKQRLHDKQRRA